MPPYRGGNPCRPLGPAAGLLLSRLALVLELLVLIASPAARTRLASSVFATRQAAESSPSPLVGEVFGRGGQARASLRSPLPRPTPSLRSRASDSQLTLPAISDPARINQAREGNGFERLSIANAENKTPPGGNPRAFASPRGDRGCRSPECGRSAGGIDAALASDAALVQPHACADAEAKGLRVQLAWRVGDAVHGWVCSGTVRGSPRGGARYACFPGCQALCVSRLKPPLRRCARCGAFPAFEDRRASTRAVLLEPHRARNVPRETQPSNPSLNRTSVPTSGTCITMQWMAPARAMMLVQSTVSMVRPGKACWNTLTACAFCAAY